ncbi:MAG TPA: glycosyltransferase [Bacteroidales bacterium]|nr:glycosyltransferase [Bacteroidales bacterium]
MKFGTKKKNKNKAQVFQTSHKTRWNSFLWITGLLGAMVLICIFVLGISLVQPSLTDFEDETDHAALKRFARQDSFHETVKEPAGTIYRTPRTKPGKRKRLCAPAGDRIRAGFYVNWDKSSFTTLEDFGGSLNMIFPEWFFVHQGKDTAYRQIDTAALRLMRDFNLEIVPVLSNFSQGFNPENVRDVLNSPVKRKKFIYNLVRIMDQYNFFGINIDFEEMTPSDNGPLINFYRELHDTFAEKKYIIVCDISPKNLDPEFINEVKDYCDYFVLMAYDQHYSLGSPGPVSAYPWTEHLLDTIGECCGLQKFILGFAGYGYDWTEGISGKSISYIQAITLASQYNTEINFDCYSYNLNFQYLDDSNRIHTVWLPDAASNFNTIRLAEDYGLAGAALWRLGVEDMRLWEFYENSLCYDSISRHPLTLKVTDASEVQDNINYNGQGDVWDIKSVPGKGEITFTCDRNKLLITGEVYKKLPATCVVDRKGYDPRKLVITFDDGPDPDYTPKILEILRSKNVPAVFFIIGENAQKYLPLVKRIYDEGHEIGNHTFTHPNVNKVSNSRFELELNATRRLIESVTGHSTIIFRTPFNTTYNAVSYNDIMAVKWAEDLHYFCVTESVGAYDWKPGFTKDSIIRSINREISRGSVMIFHDAGGNRKATVDALPEIIDYFRAEGYEFVSLAQLMQKDKSYLMPEVKAPADKYLAKTNWISFMGMYLFRKVIFAFFLFIVAISTLRCIFIMILAFIDKKKHNRKVFPEIPETELPKVSIIVPAYNEQTGIIRNLSNLRKTTYPDFEIILVDDGSQDNTYELVCNEFKDDPHFHTYRKENGGKASALNFGVERSSGTILVCIDADTQLLPSAIGFLVRHFADPRVGAVAGNVKIGNEINLLSHWQSIEYITTQNFDRRAFNLLNCITVVPGAIGAFRKQAVIDCGYYATNTMAEDCDITIQMIRKGYKVVSDSAAIAYTEAPLTANMLQRQRLRWNYGILQSFWKHRQCLMNPKYKALGLVALPNMAVFQIFMPLIAPLADVVLLISFIFGNFGTVLLYYLIFVVFEFIAGVVAFSFEKEKFLKLIYLFPQKFYYRQLMYFVAIKSLFRAVRGGMYSWGHISRKGIEEVA